MHFQAPLVEVFDHEGGHTLAVGSGLEQETGVVGILGVRDAGLYTLVCGLVSCKLEVCLGVDTAEAIAVGGAPGLHDSSHEEGEKFRSKKIPLFDTDDGVKRLRYTLVLELDFHCCVQRTKE